MSAELDEYQARRRAVLAQMREATSRGDWLGALAIGATMPRRPRPVFNPWTDLTYTPLGEREAWLKRSGVVDGGTFHNCASAMSCLLADCPRAAS